MGEASHFDASSFNISNENFVNPLANCVEQAKRTQWHDRVCWGWDDIENNCKIVYALVSCIIGLEERFFLSITSTTTNMVFFTMGNLKLSHQFLIDETCKSIKIKQHFNLHCCWFVTLDHDWQKINKLLGLKISWNHFNRTIHWNRGGCPHFPNLQDEGCWRKCPMLCVAFVFLHFIIVFLVSWIV